MHFEQWVADNGSVFEVDLTDHKVNALDVETKQTLLNMKNVVDTHGQYIHRKSYNIITNPLSLHFTNIEVTNNLFCSFQSMVGDRVLHCKLMTTEETKVSKSSFGYKGWGVCQSVGADITTDGIEDISFYVQNIFAKPQ